MGSVEICISVKECINIGENTFLMGSVEICISVKEYYCNIKKRRAEWPNGHLPENQSYPELPQDMGDLRSRWVGSVWPQKMGVIWV